MNCTVQRKGDLRSQSIPIVLRWVNIASDNLLQRPIESFSLTISLWMKCSWQVQLASKSRKQCLPKQRGETSIPITNDLFGNSKLTNHMFKEHISNIRSRHSSLTWHHYNILWKPVHDYKQAVIPTLGHRQLCYKIHANNLKWARWHQVRL